ncbi:hypothetical protein ACFLQL_00205 [Verrucomicrobiota bacterium]
MAVGTDIFGYERAASPSAVFSSELATLNFAGSDSKGLMVQGWDITYSQEIQELYEIGSSNMYWVRGHPIGQGRVQRILGTGNVKLLPEDAYNVCNGGSTFEIAMHTGSCGEDAGTVDLRLSMGGCVVSQVGFSVTIQDIRVNSNIAWRFASLADPQTSTT